MFILNVCGLVCMINIVSDISMRIEVDQPFRIVPQIRQIEKDFGFKFPEFLNTHRKILLTKEN